MSDIAVLLKETLIAAGLETSDEKYAQLLGYMDLLYTWNQVYNLTATKTKEAFIIRHLLESLLVGKHLAGDAIIDVGSGAGLPGIPLAIYYPDKHFTLLESRGKRVRFLQTVCAALQLQNVTIVHERAENYHPGPVFSVVVTRAFSSLTQMLQTTQHLCHPSGLFLAMKGRVCAVELAQIAKGFVVNTIALSVEQMDRERHLVVVAKEGDGRGKNSGDS